MLKCCVVLNKSLCRDLLSYRIKVANTNIFVAYVWRTYEESVLFSKKLRLSKWNWRLKMQSFNVKSNSFFQFDLRDLLNWLIRYFVSCQIDLINIHTHQSFLKTYVSCSKKKFVQKFHHNKSEIIRKTGDFEAGEGYLSKCQKG